MVTSGVKPELAQWRLRKLPVTNTALCILGKCCNYRYFKVAIEFKLTLKVAEIHL